VQHTSGTVQFTNGGTVFIASAGEDWSDAKTVLDSGKVVYIKVFGSSLFYQVASITTPAANAGHTPASRWEANIIGTISDPTNTTASYVLHWDFTANYNFPIPNPNDVDVATIMGRALVAADAAIAAAAAGGGGGGTGQGYQTSVVAAAATITSSQTSFRHDWRITAAAGTGAYVVEAVLPVAGRVAGDTETIHMDFAASTNPTLRIRNATVGGTILWNWTGDGTARSPWVKLVYNGSSWEVEEAQFVTFTPSGGGSGDEGQGYQPVTISVATTVTSNQSGHRHKIRATIPSGTAFTANIVLPTAGRSAGDTEDVSLDFQAGSLATINIRNLNVTGTLLWDWPGNGGAAKAWANLVFDGTAWYLHESGFV
jgi:hypothetical protein